MLGFEIKFDKERSGKINEFINVKYFLNKLVILNGFISVNFCQKICSLQNVEVIEILRKLHINFLKLFLDTQNWLITILY